MKYTGLAWSA